MIPLFQILQELRDAPSLNPKAAAFLGYYKFLPLSAACKDLTSTTTYLPPLSYYDEASHSLQPVSGGLHQAQHAPHYRIYDATRNPDSLGEPCDYIPLNPTEEVLQERYQHAQQLWKLSNPAGVLLAYSMEAYSGDILDPSPEIELTILLRARFDISRVLRTRTAIIERPEFQLCPQARDSTHSDDTENLDEIMRLADERVDDVTKWLTNTLIRVQTPNSVDDENVPATTDDNGRYEHLGMYFPV